MKVLNFHFILKALMWGILTLPHFAFSQSLNETKINVATGMKPALLEGQLLVVVFKDGVPASGVAIKTPRGVFKTNSEGVMNFSLPGGQEHLLEVVSTGQDFKVKVVPEEETQIVINLLVDKIDVVVEAAPIKENNKVENGIKKSITFDIKDTQGQALSDATVLLSGIDQVYKTNSQGQVIAELPVGSYSASAFHPDFQTQTLGEIKVGEGSESLYALKLKPAKNELEEVVVLAPKIKGSLSALVEVRKQSSAVTDVLGAEQMARAGDSDAAASLRRVTGLTLVGGKYVYVRGLGERYSGVQMNSFSLPSPEPARRVVPLDLFPTSIMESIVVQKSYSPDLPGEFGGGVIQLKTRTLPEKYFFRAALSANYENTGNGLDYAGGSQDWLGIDDGTRSMPQAVQNTINQGKSFDVNTVGFTGGVSESELVNLSKSFSNNYNLTESNAQSLPGLSMSMGNSWNLAGVKVGTSGSILYGQSTDQLIRDSKTLSTADGVLRPDTTRSTEFTETETRVAGSFDVGLEITKNQKITASTFLLRNTTKLAQLGTTRFLSDPPTETVVMDFIERQLWTRHLKGEHELKRITTIPMTLDWRLGWSDADRDNPDRREVVYDYDSQGEKLVRTDALRRNYSNLTDATEERGLNLTVPIENSTREVAKIKLGYLAIDKNRNSEMNRFMPINKNPGQVVTNPAVGLSPENIGAGTFLWTNLSANTGQADNYTGEQTITAQYAMFEVSPWETWTFQAGARQEESKQNVRTFNYTTPGEASSISTIEMNDLLPAYGVVWKPNDAIRGRLAYSETLARPDFREMSPVGYADDETGYIVTGFADLKGTVIKNIDHRWEYYFTSDEYASVGLFYKKFENPIEAVFLAGANRIQSFRNAQAAENYGVEFEGRAGMRHFSRALRRWTVLGNVSFIESQIEIDPRDSASQTSSARPLQGQSPYVFNVQLQYDRPQWGFSSTLLYNVIGKRITEVGVNGIPDTYEQPFGQLDLVSSQQLHKNWTLSFRARNLLNPSIEATQDQEVVRALRRGRTFSLVLGAVF